MNSEKLLIIGCGDVGRRLARLVHTDFQEIVGVRRRIPSTDVDTPLRYIALDASLAEDYLLLQGINPSVVVITMTPSAYTDEGYRQAYVRSCQHICASLHQQPVPPRRVIFVSSTRVYAQHAGETVDEQSATCPESFAGQRLLEAEQVIRNSGLPHCIVRFSGIYGPGRHRLLTQVRDGHITRDNIITNRIHADDCAAVLAHLIDPRKAGSASLYLATDSHPAPLGEVVAWLAGELQVPLPLPPLMDAHVAHTGKYCSNQRLLNSGFAFQYPSYQEGYYQVLGQTTGKGCHQQCDAVPD